MPEIEELIYWKGQNIEDLSKDELLQVVRYLSNRERQLREHHDTEREFWRMSRQRKKPILQQIFG